MIWECETTVIIMACNESESGKYKCETYWPSNCDEEQQYGNISVKLVKWRQVCPDFSVRTLEVTHEKTERTVIQFHYSTWPDHGVPVATTPILELVRLMRDVQATEARPILVHCSAGCGRTGTICSIDYVWALLRAGKLTEDFSLYSIIREMRKQRIAMVQTLEQYMLCYKAVAALFEQQLKIIDAHTYENLDEDGEPLILKSISFTDDSSSEEATPSQPFPPPMVQEQEEPPAVQTRVKEWVEPERELVPCRFELPKKAPSLDSLITPTFISPSAASIYGPDKLVGKATVIRRPSIAHLKAMFENMQVGESRRERSERHNRRNRKLQRSQSTKEGSSRIFSVARNFPVTPMSISHEAAAIAAQAFSIRDSSSEINDNCHNSSSNPSSCVMTYGGSTSHRTNSSEDGLRDGDQEEGMNNYNHRQTNSVNSIQSSADTGYSAASGPPKPPRTYEYLTLQNPPNNMEENGGRIIVTLAQPEAPQQSMYMNQVPNNVNYVTFHHEQHMANQMQKIRERAKHISTPNLASFSTFNSHPFNTVHHPMQSNIAFQQQFYHRPQPPQYQSFELRSHPEPIYQTLVHRPMGQPPHVQQQYHQHNIHHHHLQQQINHQHQMQQQRTQQLSQHGIYGTIGFQRVLPPVPQPQQQQPQLLPKIMPSNRISATPVVGPINIANYEDIYEVPKKRPILANEINRQNRLPVTYVRPQPNPSLSKTTDNHHTNRLNNPSRNESRSGQHSLKQKSQSSKDLQKEMSKGEKKSGFSFSVSTLFSRKKKPLNKSSNYSSSAQNLTTTNLSLPGELSLSKHVMCCYITFIHSLIPLSSSFFLA